MPVHNPRRYAVRSCRKEGEGSPSPRLTCASGSTARRARHRKAAFEPGFETKESEVTEPDKELVARLRELSKDAREVLSRAEQAEEYCASGDLSAVADTVGLMHYPINQVSDEVRGVLGFLEKRGVRPGDE